jgi:hypothetical protein
MLDPPPTNYNATGLELTADFNLFYMPVLFNLGIRSALRIEESRWVIEPVINVSTNF